MLSNLHLSRMSRLCDDAEPRAATCSIGRLPTVGTVNGARPGAHALTVADPQRYHQPVGQLFSGRTRGTGHCPCEWHRTVLTLRSWAGHWQHHGPVSLAWRDQRHRCKRWRRLLATASVNVNGQADLCCIASGKVGASQVRLWRNLGQSHDLGPPRVEWLHLRVHSAAGEGEQTFSECRVHAGQPARRRDRTGR